MAKIKEVAYRKYQLDWMMTHGYTVNDVIDQLENAAKQSFDEEDVNEHIQDHAGITRLFDQAGDIFLYETGFDGSMWVCYQEFLDAEFLDAEYMKELLSSSEYEEYLKEAGVKDFQIVKCIEFFEGS